MNAVGLLRLACSEAHRTLEATMADVTVEQAHWLPPGRALPIGALYAHVILGEDGILGLIRDQTPLMLGTWAGRVGLSELQPFRPPWDDWARRVRVDLPELREYARAVYAQTDAYLASLTDADLEGEIEFFGAKRGTAGLLVGGYVGHTYSHCGEISCLKGLQGQRGYTF